jgi:hypothetical protein
MIDEQQQHPQQLELAAVAVACFWLLLRRTQQQPGWPLRWGCKAASMLARPGLRCVLDVAGLHAGPQAPYPHAICGLLHTAPCPPGWCSLNQFLRLLAHHNLPLRLVRMLPRLMQAQQQAAAVAAAVVGAPAGAVAREVPRHARTPSSGPQVCWLESPAMHPCCFPQQVLGTISASWR